jgi:hypothetical protein
LLRQNGRRPFSGVRLGGLELSLSPNQHSWWAYPPDIVVLPCPEPPAQPLSSIALPRPQGLNL